jgi:hypothetical protein
MIRDIRAVLAIAEIKATIERFDSGEENAAETLFAIVKVCKAAKLPPSANRDAA